MEHFQTDNVKQNEKKKNYENAKIITNNNAPPTHSLTQTLAYTDFLKRKKRIFDFFFASTT